MGKMKLMAAGAVAFATLTAAGAVEATAVAPASAASDGDIAWFYNSGDHDAKVRFRQYGDHLDLCKLNNASVYAEYMIGNSTTKYKYHHDGTQDTCRTKDLNMTEGVEIRVRACEEKNLAPNDCSGWRSGQS